MIAVSKLPHLQLSGNYLINVLTAVSNFIIFNEKKTKCMCFKPNSLNGLFVPTLCLNDVPLTFVASNKYLGVIIHDKHQDEGDIMRYVKSLYSSTTAGG